MMVVDALLRQVVAQGPTVLVVDDVQWADPATWDALSYLVAGFGHQRMALVTTHRDEATVRGHFQHWLGNIHLLPSTEQLMLTRLDQDATGDQIAALLGRPPPARLVEQVYEWSGGNPYFSELLVRRGDKVPRTRRGTECTSRSRRPASARPTYGRWMLTRDRRGALHQREDGERARLEPAAQDQHRVTPRGRRARPTRGMGHQQMSARDGPPAQ